MSTPDFTPGAWRKVQDFFRHIDRKRIRNFLKYCYAKVDADSLTDVAGNISFTIILSLVPILAIMLAVFTRFPAFGTLRHTLETYFAQGLIPGNIARTILDYLGTFAANAANVSIIGALAVLWFAVLIAPYVSEGLPGIVPNLPEVMNHPFHLQSMAQLKALFEKEWESIAGNCDSFLYLGGNERSTHEYVSKMLGKETINSNTFGQTSGSTGHYSKNTNLGGRELLMDDEVRMLDNRYALLFIRGERPVMDQKYDIMKHPNIRYTEDGGAEPYEHGTAPSSIASMQAFRLDPDALEDIPDVSVDASNYELLSEEDFEENKEDKNRRPK